MSTTPATLGLRGTAPYLPSWLSSCGGNPTLNTILNNIDNWALNTETFLRTGWIKATETWTFNSYTASLKTGVINVPAANTKYSVGMRVSFEQATGGKKYGIITGVSPSTLTVYFGTLYDLTNEPINSNFYSYVKNPLGFNTNPEFWRFRVTDSTLRERNNPTSYVLYNLGGFSLTVPQGAWCMEYAVFIAEQGGTTGHLYSPVAALSTTPSTSTIPDLYCEFSSYNEIAHGHFYTRKADVTLTAPTVFYLNVGTYATSPILKLSLINSHVPATIIATCNYL